MKIEAFLTQLHNRLNEILLDKNALDDDLSKIAITITKIQLLLDDLNNYVSKTTFSRENEVKVFKEVKPKFLSQYFFHKKVFEVKVFNSFNNVKRHKKNYQQQLKHLENFATTHLDFFQYYFSASTNLDAKYFTRSNNQTKPNRGQVNSDTEYSLILGELLANELLKNFLINQIDRSSDNGDALETRLHWTASKTELVELIYALQSAEVFNNGSANIKSVASAFGAFFGVQLKDFYRTFLEIRIRKKSPAAFIDKLKDKFMTRLEAE